MKKAFERGTEDSIKKYKDLSKQIASLPNSGIPGKLKNNVQETIQNINDYLKKDEFYKYAADIDTALSNMEYALTESVNTLLLEQKDAIEKAQNEVAVMSEWYELTSEEQQSELAKIEALSIEAYGNIDGLRKLLNNNYEFNELLADIKSAIKQTAQERIKQKLEEERAKAKKAGKTKITKAVKVKRHLTSKEELNTLIEELQELKSEIEIYPEIDISFEVNA